MEDKYYDEQADRLLSSLDEGEDNSFPNYVETTINPGNILLIIAIVSSLCSIACVPLVARLGKCLSRCSKTKCKKLNKFISSDDDGASEDEEEERHPDNETPDQSNTPDISRQPSFIRRASNRIVEVGDFTWTYFLHNVLKSKKKHGAYTTYSVPGRQNGNLRGMEIERCASMAFHQQQEAAGVVIVGVESPRPVGLDICNEPAEQFKDSKGIIHFTREVIRFDRESKRILRLAIPFTCSAIAKTLSELFILAIISHNVGNDAIIAYAVTYSLVGITSTFMGGFHDSVSTLVGMAYGAENYTLGGQYLRTACLSYILGEIPLGIMWYFIISKVLHFMGYTEMIIDLAQNFVGLRIVINMMMGVNQSILNFLSTIDYEKFANVVYCIGAIANASFVAIAAYLFNVNLTVLGLIIWVNASIMFLIIVFVPFYLGWMQKYENGLFRSFARTDIAVTKDVVKVALPLAFGALLAYAEWEILTFFAATLGPAEAAAWTMMGFVWDTFESTTEAIGDTSEVRVSYQLGRGRPAMAKLAAYKCMLLGLGVSGVISIIAVSLSDVLPSLLTTDVTLQAMLTEMFPIVALGNVTMSMGMVCWTVIGAQGRYHLSTSVALTVSFVVTIPLGAIMTIGLNIDPQGLVFAIFMGYTVTAMILFALIVMSDWEKLSEKIQKQVASGEISLSDSSCDEISCSSEDNQSEQISIPPIQAGLVPCNIEIQRQTI
jgi:MATE family multidrug resistance protein